MRLSRLAGHLPIILALVASSRIAQGQMQPGNPGDDALEPVLNWASEWSGVDAMIVEWRRQRNRRDSTGAIVQSDWLMERTRYRWPDSFRRVVKLDSAGPATAEEIDEDEVEEGIDPDGSHVRKLLGMPQAEVMRGPGLVDALPREMVRAPFLLARWVIEEGFERDDLDVRWGQNGEVVATCLSARVEFEMQLFADSLVLTKAASLAPDGVAMARYEITEPQWPEGLPGPMGSQVRVEVRSGTGSYGPAAPLALVSASVIDRPTDAELHIPLDRMVVTNRITEETILPGSGTTVPISPTKPQPSHIAWRAWLLGGGVSCVVAAFGLILWRRTR